jgi:hypothetical protein
MTIINRRKIYIFLYCLGLIALAIFFHADHFLNGDEGVTLNGAWNLYNGRRLYFDFFSFLPPLSFYLIAALWYVVGVSFWSAKILSIFFLLLGALGLYKIAEKLKPGNFNLLVPFFFILSSSWLWIINHNFFQLILVIWSSYFFIIYLSSRRRRFLFIAALLAGFSLITLQQKGLAFGGASGLFLLFQPLELGFRNRIKPVLLYIFGILASLVVLLLFWPPVLLWNNLLIFPLFNYLESNRISYNLLLLAFVAFVALIFTLRTQLTKSKLFLLVITGALLISCYPLPDYYHLSLALSPLIALLPELLLSIKGWRRDLWSWLSLGILSYLWLWPVSIFFAFLLFNFSFSAPYPFLDYIRRECPGEYLHVGPFLPGVYLETGKLSATSFDILITGHQTEPQFIQAAAQLKAAPPSCAVTVFSPSLRRFRHDINNPVDVFIRDNYQPVFFDGAITVWRRAFLEP